jgi:hypothetical protein
VGVASERGERRPEPVLDGEAEPVGETESCPREERPVVGEVDLAADRSDRIVGRVDPDEGVDELVDAAVDAREPGTA